MVKKCEFSVVVPVYNSEDCLDELAKQIHAVFTKIERSYELILVNDGSVDRSWSKIQQLADANAHIVGICLRKNFGQDNALMAGLRTAQGQYVIIMDDDLQHDPYCIPQLIAEIENGFDVVYACYTDKKQKLWKNLGSWFNGQVANIVLKKPAHVYMSPYKIIASTVVKNIIEYNGAYPYVDGLLFRVTSNFSQIQIDHKNRFKGSSNYTFWRSLRVWSYLATNFSIIPLRIATITGLLSAITGLGLGSFFIIEKLLYADNPEGWTSIIVSIFVLAGMQLFAIGVMGEYIGRTYLNINNQPQFVVKEIIQKNRW